MKIDKYREVNKCRETVDSSFSDWVEPNFVLHFLEAP